jgi:ectoine hydroxylase-related dioxygenase (phytanoyl-CoA dioxygenase family)
MVRHIPCQAGDCILFTEALTHGTMPWKNPYPRRALFYKYSPNHLSWSNRYYIPAEGNPEVQAFWDNLNPTQRVLLEPPGVYKHGRLP